MYATIRNTHHKKGIDKQKPRHIYTFEACMRQNHVNRVKSVVGPSPSISAMWKTYLKFLLNNITTDVNMQNMKECVNNTGNLCNDNDIDYT